MRGKRLLLIDGPGLAYRSYFAFARNPLVSSAGELTSVPFGFARALARMIEDEKPNFWAAAFDTPAPTFRHKEYVDYKANRPGMPDDMRCQLDRIDELLTAIRLPRLAVEGYEADDLIGTLAVQAVERGMDVLLVTEDKDFCQIVSDKIHILSLPKGGRRGARLDPDGVRKKLGVPPEQVVDLLALVGDASDNVPGVRGVGPKTATALLKSFSCLEDIYKNIDLVTPPRVRERLIENRETAYMSKRLVTLALDAPVNLDLDEMKRGEPDRQMLVGLLKELEFTRLAEAFLADWVKGASAPDPAPARVVRDKDAGALRPEAKRGGDVAKSGSSLGHLLAEEGTASTWAFALGPDSTGRMGLAVCGPSTKALHFPAAEGRERAAAGEFLAGEKYHKAVYDLKAEGHVASGAGWDVSEVVSDVMLASYLLGPEERHDLESLAAKYLGAGAPKTEKMTSSGYLRWKAGAVRDLDEVLSPRVSDAGMENLYRDIEIPLARILMEMEQAGVELNLKALSELSSRLKTMLERSEENIFCIAGATFNINSPQQLSDILFRHLGLPHKRRTKTGYSTDSSVLEELAAEHELPREILNYRRLAKLKSTYADALPRMVDAGTSRVHATFHQTVAATGRLSSSNPNLQNIPIRTDLGVEIRKAFIPGGRNRVLLAADYSQIEFRIMAHLAGDDALRESFIKGEDAHSSTAAAVFGVPLEEVDENLRARAKTVNYGVMYGMGPQGLARTLGISRKEAADFIDDYFAKMPAVKIFLSKLVEKARENGHATTILNRRRPLPAIGSSNPRARAYAERMAVNTPLQGSAADIIKKAMVDLSRLMKRRSMKSKLILQVHDELVFECPRGEADDLKALVIEIMESAVELSVPLSVTVGIGDNWWETHR